MNNIIIRYNLILIMQSMNISKDDNIKKNKNKFTYAFAKTSFNISLAQKYYTF